VVETAGFVGYNGDAEVMGYEESYEG